MGTYKSCGAGNKGFHGSKSFKWSEVAKVKELVFYLSLEGKI
jgi:hypothetical protein